MFVLGVQDSNHQREPLCTVRLWKLHRTMLYSFSCKQSPSLSRFTRSGNEIESVGGGTECSKRTLDWEFCFGDAICPSPWRKREWHYLFCVSSFLHGHELESSKSQQESNLQTGRSGLGTRDSHVEGRGSAHWLWHVARYTLVLLILTVELSHCMTECPPLCHCGPKTLPQSSWDLACAQQISLLLSLSDFL